MKSIIKLLCIIVKGLRVDGKEIARPIPSENFEIQYLGSSDSGIKQRRLGKVRGQEYKIAWVNCFELRAKLGKMVILHYIIGKYICIGMHDA